MKFFYALIGVIALTASPVMAADNGSFMISPRVGRTTITIDRDMLASNERVDVDTLTTGIALGYVAPFNLLVEGGYTSQGNWTWFGTEDKYRLSEYNIVLGYQINTPHDFVITPRVGRARWDLYSRDVALTHPADPLDPQRERGYDNFWEISLQKKVGRSAALGISYRDNSYGFGNVKSIVFLASIKM
ncbi:MAG TPA: hypothetical protein VG962_08605 [Steroidobacteraceae bacterium]|nr:hypothetical protein [Steroidobacteraceae bacterium]